MHFSLLLFVFLFFCILTFLQQFEAVGKQQPELLEPSLNVKTDAKQPDP